MYFKTNDGYATKYWLYSHDGAFFENKDSSFGIRQEVCFDIDELMSVYLPRLKSNLAHNTFIKRIQGLDPRYQRDPVTKVKSID
jgi:hypothetical protein